MPHSISAEKRLRQNAKRRQRNHSIRSTLKSTARRIRSHLQQGKKAEAEAMLKTLSSQLDRAQAKGIVKKNYASRQKSRLAQAIKSLSSA